MKKFTKTTVQTVAIGFAILLLTSNLNAQNTFPSAGNVGIGTSSPSAKLQIVNTSDDGFFKINELRGYSHFDPRTGTWQTVWEEIPIFKVHNNGNVGIGLNNPLHKFHVVGNGYFSGSTYVNERLGIGTTTPLEKLHLNNGNILITNGRLIIQNNSGLGQGSNQIALNGNGIIECREVQVDLGVIPDYVFAEDYNLMPLADVKAFIEANKHLPNVKSEAEFKEQGSISLTEMNLKLLEKVEELTLYILQLEVRISELEK